MGNFFFFLQELKFVGKSFNSYIEIFHTFSRGIVYETMVHFQLFKSLAVLLIWKDIRRMIICVLPTKDIAIWKYCFNKNKPILSEGELFASDSGMICSVFGFVGINMQMNSTFSDILKLIAFIDCFTVCQHGNCSWTCNVYGRLIGLKAILIKYKCNSDLEIFFIKKKSHCTHKFFLPLFYDTVVLFSCQLFIFPLLFYNLRIQGYVLFIMCLNSMPSNFIFTRETEICG